MTAFTEDQVHTYIYRVGLEALVKDCPTFDAPEEEAEPEQVLDLEGDEVPFELWRIIKRRAFEKLQRLHNTIRYGEFIGSKIKLRTDSTRPMELDLLGTHEDGLFVLELKVDRSAERNAFSELFAYSNYLAGMFALSGHQDITNMLVANLDVKITRQAFLYDLLISERNIIVYQPIFVTSALDTLQLELWLPSDEDFQQFTNRLLSHNAMSCVVVSFHDLEGWYDSNEDGGSLNDWTRKHLSMLSGYAAQLMEAERLHGFCFIRKPWESIPRFYRNSLFIVALNPFHIVGQERAGAITEQIDVEHQSYFFEMPRLGFDGRLLRLAERSVKDSLNIRGELETPTWSSIVTSPQEVVFSHNFAFRPTGMFREAYVDFLNQIYARNDRDEDNHEDVSTLKINEVNNWLRAWQFMEACGFAGGEDDDINVGDEDDPPEE
ncbi:hypothetical protein D2T29_12980 [Sinirhodobacter populi]|uniref:Uncharacterized protein n=1 Tax=Paenirhodobacter populi TaxID=2306993 RepID=A0A443KBQ6_9RHOB|nr:hypothetical protein [Sinirhodobacter populi]RWR30198.1 hypothetical protein D2T29_12980 [Sinirhodobacter populi]